ncbi:MAG: ribonuclease [Oscillospiraceae bacterium]|nr:ribonuclease [Oscillospiraceae bacterium]
MPTEDPAADPALDETPAAEPETPSEEPSAEPGSDEPEASVPIPDEDGWYYDVENVTAYLMAYGHLPSNYITKRDAEDLGWSGGSVERFREGAAIGGGRFGNYEGLLPEGRYTECDIDTDGASSRGAKRLVFSTDGRYFYTDDHYETFAEVTFVDGRMVLNYDY